MENVWHYLRANKLSLLVWDGYEAIVAACKDAWHFLISDPDRIRSIGTRVGVPSRLRASGIGLFCRFKSGARNHFDLLLNGWRSFIGEQAERVAAVATDVTLSSTYPFGEDRGSGRLRGAGLRVHFVARLCTA